MAWRFDESTDEFLVVDDEVIAAMDILNSPWTLAITFYPTEEEDETPLTMGDS